MVFNRDMNKLKEIYKIYGNHTMLAMTALGFASGFPFLLVFSTLSLWLKEAGWTYAAIGAFSLVKIPYSFKWVWSPVLDRLKLPLLWRMGRRRSWALLMQLFLLFLIAAMGYVNPETERRLLWICAIAVSLASASLDIVLDALRVESFQKQPEDQAPGSAVFVLGYRLGLIFSGAGALWLASFISWGNVYLIMATGSLVGLMTILLIKEPDSGFAYSSAHPKIRLKQFYQEAVKAPLKDFTKHQHWMMILFLIFIYRMSDAYFGPMAFPFYSDMGFSKTEIAYIIKIYGMFAAIAGGLAGGLLIKKVGLYKGLYICAYTQGLTTLLFSLQAMAGHNTLMLTAVISLENFSSGMATTALVAYISSLCNVLYTATQYALLSSVMSLARDLFAATSGLLAEWVSWPVFFMVAALFSIPGIVMVKYLMRQNDDFSTLFVCKNKKKEVN